MTMAPAKAALVTGGARRLGREIALHLASMGYDIALHFNTSKDEAAATGADIGKLGGKCELLAADLTHYAAVSELLPRALAAMPGINLLVHSASVWRPSSFPESDIRGLRENFAVHVEAPYILSRDFARLVGDGQIISILDTAITSRTTSFFPYLLSKKTLWSLTEMLAVELAPRIRVNAVAPGMVLPPEGDAKSVFKKEGTENLLCRPGSPADVTAAIEFLIKASHVTGQCIFVDGGEHSAASADRSVKEPATDFSASPESLARADRGLIRAPRP